MYNFHAVFLGTVSYGRHQTATRHLVKKVYGASVLSFCVFYMCVSDGILFGDVQCHVDGWMQGLDFWKVVGCLFCP